MHVVKWTFCQLQKFKLKSINNNKYKTRNRGIQLTQIEMQFFVLQDILSSGFIRYGRTIDVVAAMRPRFSTSFFRQQNIVL